MASIAKIALDLRLEPSDLADLDAALQRFGLALQERAVPRCDGCKWWQLDSYHDDYGICSKATWFAGKEAHEDAKMIPGCTCHEEDQNNQTLATTPDFGCVMWEAN